eukprot:1188239-Prorocentrum_minimum.AAC.6
MILRIFDTSVDYSQHRRLVMPGSSPLLSSEGFRHHRHIEYSIFILVRPREYDSYARLALHLQAHPLIVASVASVAAVASVASVASVDHCVWASSTDRSRAEGHDAIRDEGHNRSHPIYECGPEVREPSRCATEPPSGTTPHENAEGRYGRSPGV